VYKNPKKQKEGKYQSVHQSKSQPRRLHLIPVNSEKFLSRKHIPEDEVFFYNYFKLAQEHSIKKKKKEEEEEDEENMDRVGDEEFDEYLKNYYKGTEHDIEKAMAAGADDEDEDDFEAALEEDDELNAEDEELQAALGTDSDEEEEFEEELPAKLQKGKKQKKLVEEDEEMDFDDDLLLGAEDSDDDAMLNVSDGEEDNDDFGGLFEGNNEPVISVHSGLIVSLFLENDDEDISGGKGKKKRAGSSFASAEDFADILEQSGEDGVSAKQRKWEDRKSSKGASFNKKRPFSKPNAAVSKNNSSKRK
jgi:hypothetical protein